MVNVYRDDPETWPNGTLFPWKPDHPRQLDEWEHAIPGRTRGAHSPSLRLFPIEDFFPCLLVEEIMDLDHGLYVFLWRLPALSNERVVELLRGWVFPDLGIVPVGRSVVRVRRVHVGL